MKLRSSPSSPFGRKVKMATYILGLSDQVSPVLTDTMDPNDNICDVNPLGKIPVLEDGGNTYYDSRVIMEYLDAKAGGARLYRPAVRVQFDALTRAALMEGILDAAVLIVYESRMRPDDKYVRSVVERQRGKISRGLAVIAAGNPAYKNGAMPDVGENRIGVRVDYLDFRKQVNWRDHAPGLEEMSADFCGYGAGICRRAHRLATDPSNPATSICRGDHKCSCKPV